MVKDNSYGIAPLQDKMLDILKHFISVCEKYGLKYYLAGGTCIGALRHHGFIPWDDDLDVFMPRPDYEKLWSIMKDNNDGKYVFCRTTDDKNYHHRVIQLVDLNTTFIHERCKDEDIEHGVYIDIIPLDACPDNFISCAVQKVNAIIFSIYNIQCMPEYSGGKLTGIMRIITSLMLNAIKKNGTRNKIWNNAERRMTKYDWFKSKKCICITASLHELLTPFPIEWLGTRTVKFEDVTVNIPLKAEDYCRVMYGDYMKLPAVEKRRVVHKTVLIDLENSYLKYKGKYYCKNSK